jgi:hypothetical protein
MTDSAKTRETALALMQEALALLDHAGEDIAAIHLQYAVDIASGLTAMRPMKGRDRNIH